MNPASVFYFELPPQRIGVGGKIDSCEFRLRVFIPQSPDRSGVERDCIYYAEGLALKIFNRGVAGI